jgi:hypothetical protein
MEFCCENLQANAFRPCDQHGLECPDNVIRWHTSETFKDRAEYGIEHPDGNSYIRIDFCPFCGKQLIHPVTGDLIPTYFDKFTE